MSRKRSVLAFATAALVISPPALAEDAAPASTGPVVSQSAPAQPPRLVVAIAVDQFSADLFAQYRVHYTRGLARLQTGAVFPSAFQSHSATETCPGHSTLLTGAHPAHTGIVANNWFDPKLKRDEKQIYCAEDETDPASSPDEPVVSAGHLKVPTLGDRMKAANPLSRNVSVSAKDRAAMMMGGHSLDASYWWEGEGFVTFRGRKPSAAAKAENAQLAGEIAAGKPGLPVPAFCTAMDRPVHLGAMTVGTYKFEVPPGQPKIFKRTTYVDRATADLAIRLIDEMKLGADTVPDVLSVSFSATDYVGHAFGHEGVEMCLQMDQLDRNIGLLLDALDKRGIDYVVVLTADHGGIDAPERLTEQGFPQAARADASLDIAALSAEVTKKAGIAAPSGPLLFGGGGSGDIYVSAGVPAKDKQKVVAGLVEILKAHPQVAAVFTAQELAQAPAPAGRPQDWTLLDRARGSFDASRSGDVTVLLDRGIVPGEPRPGYVTTHGSPWDYDRRVPLLFWRKGMPGMEQPAPVETVDIAPTLAALLDLKVEDGAFDGRCLDIDGSAGNICD